MFLKVLKITGIVIGIVLLLLALLLAAALFYFLPDEDRLVDFIHKNPERTALMLVRNDSVIAQQNIHRVMPLASTVKIILAIEYAEQSAANRINPDSLVSLHDLDKFYVANTDGGAHEAWLESVNDKITNNEISVREIAKGMIAYSSNANTEWLLNELGIEQVNNRLDSLDLKNHTEIYNIVSALFVGKELFPSDSGEILEGKMKALSTSAYIAATQRIHEKLKTDTIYRNQTGDLSMNIQKIWSDRLPAASVSDYVSVMQKINSRTYFDKKTQEYLDEVMEYMLEIPENREWLQHSGMKGGSTAFVLTTALYATDKEGNKTEMAYFFNDLKRFEMARLELSMSDFELQTLKNADFRKKIQEKIGK